MKVRREGSEDVVDAEVRRGNVGAEQDFHAWYLRVDGRPIKPPGRGWVLVAATAEERERLALGRYRLEDER